MASPSPIELSPSDQEVHRFRPDIQGIRALAVLLVVIFHADLPLPGGYVGVDVFFVVSGFVITGMLRSELESTGKISFREFYARRARRLLPALAAVTAVTLVISAVVLPVTGALQKASEAAAATSVFSANLYFLRFGDDYFSPTEANPFLHMWSLAVEEQIYFVVPAFLLIMWAIGTRFGSGARGAAIGLGVISAGSFLFASALLFAPELFPIEAASKYAFYLPFTRLWEFGFGAILALLPASLAITRRRVRTAVGVAGMATIFYGSFAFDASTVFPGPAALVPVVGTTALILAGTGSGPTRSLLSKPVMVWLGGLSYGWYLWHWPAIVLTRTIFPNSEILIIAVAFGSLGLAVLTQRLIENPFRYNRSIIGWRALAVAGACVLAPLALASFVLAGANRGWGVVELQVAIATQRRIELELDQDQCGLSQLLDGCWFGDEITGKVLLVGDSHAGSLSDTVKDAAVAGGLEFGIRMQGGCRLNTQQGANTAISPSCQQWTGSVLRWIEQEQAEFVVIALNGSGHTGDLESVGAYLKGLEDLINEIRTVGSEVVLISSVPTFSTEGLAQASFLRRSPHPDSVSLAAAPQWRTSLRSDELGLARIAGVTVIDSVAVLCNSKDLCSQKPDAKWEYRDSNHLTTDGARRLLPAISTVFGD